MEVVWAPASPQTGPDSIYVRDAAVVCDAGVVLGRMGKEARRGEPAALEEVFEALGVERAGAVRPMSATQSTEGRNAAEVLEAPGLLEGGDVVWLDGRTVAVGRGYRTDDQGIRHLADALGDEADRILRVPLPHWRGPEGVFHLMSILSPVADDLALVHAPLLPVPFRELLLERGTELVEVVPGEFATQGCNVLAVAPRVVVALEGNPQTRRRLEAAGVEVHTYVGAEISVKGGGGPTCLVRTLEREG